MDYITSLNEGMGYKAIGDCYCHIEMKDMSGYAVISGEGMLLLRIASDIIHRASRNIGIEYDEAVAMMARLYKERRMEEKHMQTYEV